MATLISGNGDGNFATAATWKNVCTGAGALDTTLTGTTVVGTGSYTYGVAFTVTNAEVIEGVAVLMSRSGLAEGTVTLALSEDNGTTATRTLTLNATDIPTTNTWVFFKFSSPLTADGGSDYRIGFVKSSNNDQFSIYRRSATSGDWSHILREDSAPGSLSAGDVFYIMDDWTAAATKTTNTVTMNNTATTDFGAITVGQGTLTFGTSASTNYYLKSSGDVTVWGGGTLNIGTTGTAMPSTSTAVLELDPTSDGEFGLIIKDGATLSVQGASMTRVWDLLATNEAANSTSWTTANSRMER